MGRQLKIFTVVLVALSLTVGSVSAAQNAYSVREFLSAKDRWPTFASNSTQLTLNGRLAGSIARQFRLSKLPFLVSPERTTALPSDVDTDERISITGVLRKTGNRYQFDVSRIGIGARDTIRFQRRIKELPDGSFADAYALADRFEAVSYTHLTLPTIYSV